MKFLLYCFFFTLTMPFLPAIGGEVLVYEIPLTIMFISLPLALRRHNIHFQGLDFGVLAYLIISVLSTFINPDSNTFYDAARYFRWTVLPPVAIYAIIRFAPLSLGAMYQGLYWMMPGIIFRGVLLVQDYSHYGVRGMQYGGSFVTTGIFIAIGVILLLFVDKRNFTILLSILRYIMLGFLFVCLVLTFSRGVVIGTIIFSLISAIVWKNIKWKKYFGQIVLGTIIFISLVIGSGALFLEPVSVPERAMLEKTYHRLYEKDLYLHDIYGLFNVWSMLSQDVLQNNFFLGKGMAATKVGYDASDYQSYGSSHNFFVSMLRRSGILGAIIMFWMIWLTYKNMVDTDLNSHQINTIGKTLLTIISTLILVGFTNDFMSGNRCLIWFIFISYTTRISGHTNDERCYGRFRARKCLNSKSDVDKTCKKNLC